MGQFISQLLSIPDLNALTSGAGKLLIRNSGDTAWELRVIAAADLPATVAFTTGDSASNDQLILAGQVFS